VVDGPSTTLFGGRCHIDHVRYRERAIAERRRDRLLLEAGFEVVHVTWQELFSDAARVAGRIREAFRRAERLGFAR
jgi:very-short-patch-repair endonuclease